MNLPFYAVLGNHDYRRNEKAQVDYTSEHPESRWKMPGRYHSFNHELPDGTRIEFFGIDTNTIETEEVQLAWLSDALSQSAADWKIVFGHHVLYSNGHCGDNTVYSAGLPGFMAFEVSGDRLLVYVLLADGGIDHIHTLRK